MYGKILKISSNDLYGNTDDRMVSLFAVFIHKKYMNKYAIFTFSNEFNKNKLYYASVHLKANSIVTFSVRSDEETYISKFVQDYLNGNVDSNEYELIDISNIDKIEIISNTPVDCDKLTKLDNLSIQKVNDISLEENHKKPVFLYLLLIIFILLLGGIIYLHYNPSILEKQLNKLDCTKEDYDKKVELSYTSIANIKFDRHNELKSMNKIDTYKFSDLTSYEEFKNNNKESTYFDLKGSYKYDDNDLTLKLIYEDKIIIYQYDELLRYMKKEGYSCIEGVYHE